jgi:type I restriction enzyme M protein
VNVFNKEMEIEKYSRMVSVSEIEKVEGKKGEFDCDLLPKALLIDRFFNADKQMIEDLTSKLDTLDQEVEELIEENNGEEGCFSEFEKINKANVTARIKEIKNKKEDLEELYIMEKYLLLLEKESEAKKKIRDAEKTLDDKVLAKYKTLSGNDIKTLVVNFKWMASLEKTVKGEMDRISQRITQRIKELAERYETPLPDIIEETEKLTKKVNEHLLKMGYKI